MIKAISGREYPVNVIPLIESAKQSIDIIVFDWRWYPQDPGAACQLFNQSVLRAARRGVKIRAVVNNDHIINILNKEGCNAKRLSTTKLVHCKLMIIDDKIIIAGSHNYTQSAFNVNFELSVIIDEPDYREPFIRFFKNVWFL